MKHKNSIQNIRSFIYNGLRIRLTPGNPDDLRNTALAFQNIISQIPDKIIEAALKDGNLRLRIQKLKPKPSNENPSAKPSKKRHR